MHVLRKFIVSNCKDILSFKKGGCWSYINKRRKNPSNIVPTDNSTVVVSRIFDLCMSASSIKATAASSRDSRFSVWRLFTVNLLNLHLLLSHVLPHKKYKMEYKKIYAKFLSENSMDESEIATVAKKYLTCVDLDFDSKKPFHNFFYFFIYGRIESDTAKFQLLNTIVR